MTYENACGPSITELEVTVDLGGCDPCQIMQSYPNPASTELTIEIMVAEGEKLVTDVILINSKSEKVYAERTGATEIKIPTGNLPNGLYFLKVSNPNGSESKQIFINH